MLMSLSTGLTCRNYSVENIYPFKRSFQAMRGSAVKHQIHDLISGNIFFLLFLSEQGAFVPETEGRTEEKKKGIVFHGFLFHSSCLGLNLRNHITNTEVYP